MRYDEIDAQAKAVVALGRIRDAAAVEPLVRYLKDGYGGVRGDAAEVLGMIGDERVVEPLIEALKNEYSLVREAAKKALEKIREKNT